MRAYKTENGAAIFRLSDHTTRLFDAASKINIEIPFSMEELNVIQCFLNKIAKTNCIFRQRGLGLRAKDLSVNVAVAAWECHHIWTLLQKVFL